MYEMFESLMAKLGTDPETDFDPAIRRAHVRREADHCVSVIEGKTYPVENWSPGGVLIHGDSREFGVNDEVDFTIKFKLRDDVIDVPHKAKVIRKSRDKVAFEFLPLTDQIKKSFLSVVDDYMAREFSESQTV